MKKLPALILLIVFLIANSNVAMSMHWCGGRLVSVAIFSGTQHPCKCGQKAMKPDCCKNKTVEIKANKELIKSTTHFTLQNSATKILFIVNNIFLSSKQSDIITPYYTFIIHPPNKLKTPIFLLDRAFLI